MVAREVRIATLPLLLGALDEARLSVGGAVLEQRVVAPRRRRLRPRDAGCASALATRPVRTVRRCRLYRESTLTLALLQ